MLPKISAIAALPLLGVAALPITMQAQQSPEQILVQRASMLDAQGRHDLAAENWRQVLLIHPGQVDALAALINYYGATGDTAKVKQYQAALQRTHPGASISGSAAMTHSGDTASSLREASRLAAAHKYAESLALYQRSFGSEQPPDEWGIAYYETEAAIPAKQPHAVAGLRSLASKYPANPSYQLALARVLTYRPATRLEGARLLALVQGTPEQNEQARAAWRQAILWDPGAPTAVETSKQYLERFPDPEVSSKLASAPKHTVPVKPNSPLESEGYRALASGDLDSAQERFAALAREPEHAGQGEAGLGYVAMKRKDFSAATKHFDRAHIDGLHSPALEKALGEARYWQAMSEGNDALAAGDADTAASQFELARSLNAARPEANEALGGSLLAEKDSGQAQEVFAQELRTNAHRPDAWIGWMNATLEAGNASELLSAQTSMPSDVKQVLARRPDYLALLAAAELATGNKEIASRLVERIQEIAPKSASQGAGPQVRAAGLLLSLGYYEQAIQLSSAVVKGDSENLAAWQTLVQAEHAAGRDELATKIATRMPKSVDAAAMSNPEFLIALASIYQSQHQYTIASRLLEQASSMNGLKPHTASALEVQRASLALASGDPHTAYTIYRRMQQQTPDDPTIWTGAINALHAGKHDAEALAAIEAMPPAITARVRRDPAFLQTAAFVYSENGRSRDAMLCLRAVVDQYVTQHQPVPFAVDSESAWLLLNAGRDKELAATLERLGSSPHLTDEQSNTLKQIWMTWSIRRAEGQYTKGDSKSAIALLHAAVEAYPDQLNGRMALANMYAKAGNPGLSIKMFLDMDWTNASVDQYEAAINAALVGHNMKYADFWLKLGLEQYPGNTTLLRAGARVQEQHGDTKKAMQYLASAKGERESKDVSLSTLEAELSKGHTSKTSLVSSATVLEGGESTPQSELARLLGVGGPTKGASSTEEPWTDSGQETLTASTEAALQPVAYAVPPPQHAQSNSDPLADLLGTSKKKEPAADGWPGDEPTRPRQRAPKGVPAMAPTAETPVPPRRGAQRTPDPLDGLGIGAEAGQTESSSRFNEGQNTTSAKTDGLKDILSGGAATATAEVPTRHTNFAEGLEPELKASTGRSPVPPPMPLEHLLGPEPVINSTQQKAADDLSALQSRYSPWFATGGSYRTRTGTAGFDQMQDYEASMEGSTVMGTAARLTVVTRPVSLQSGIPDATSNYRFGRGGTLPTTSQFASGLGADVQFATRNLEAAVGYAPTNFAVKNFIGSFAVRPAQGPITLRVYRDNIKDTLLSYAGMTDPNTGEVWGGVVGTGGAVELHRGGADSGFYATIDGQKLTGRNVTQNSRVMGNAGAYWLAMSNAYGHLKVGANLMAMHYAINERYFTFGQGGYFSPNSFFMVNAPVTWEGRPVQRTYYTVSGSLGAQNIQEGQAISGSLIVGNGVQTLSGASYDLHGKVGHRITDHWDLEGFVDVNNARQYADRAAGFSIRFMRFPQPADATPGGFLDQKAVRPLQRP